MAKRTATNNASTASLGFQAELWAAADALRNTVKAASAANSGGERDVSSSFSIPTVENAVRGRPEVTRP
ncbi:MAG: hypothetical protein EA382_16765 [Spirochaetaceae bacterium]|nr:MAG: hypothetical protein EA382_16765 [Spirochaetaceae bacterium]